jgi:hypothetical protein
MTDLSDQGTVSETAKATQHEAEVDILKPLAPAPQAGLRPTFVSVQEWEGVVNAVLEDGFTARLVDLTGGGPDEESTFFLAEVSEGDRKLIEPGAIFRWSAGLLTMPGGGKFATSQVVFRRLPKWTERDLLHADGIARRLIDNLAPQKDNEARSAG